MGVISVFLAFMFFLFTLEPNLFLGYFLISFLLLLVIAYFYWSLRFKEPMAFSTIILPLQFQLSFYLFFIMLTKIYTLPAYIVYFLVFLFFILYYLLLRSVKELRGFSVLPLHNSRIILNSITLFTSYLFFLSISFMELASSTNLIIIFLFMFFIFFQSTLWWSRKNINASVVFSLVGAFVLTELFWIVGLLPQDVFVVALLILNLQHMLTGIIQSYFKKALSSQVLSEYIIIPAAIILILLFTSKWLPTYN